jgi:hypothetical protein
MKGLKLHLLAAGCIAASLCSPAWAATDLSFGQTASGTILVAAQVDSYTFTASASDVVIFTATATSGTLLPLIQLYNPSSTLIGTAPGSCTSATAVEMSPVTLTATGDYTVMVSDCSATNTGGYDLYAQRTNNPSGAANFAFGSAPVSLINLPAQSDSFTFSASASDVVDLTMTATSGALIPKIRLYNPNGSLNSSIQAGGAGCSGTSVEMNGVSLLSTGTYTVLLGDCGDTNTGNYTVYAQRTNNPTAATPVAWGQTQAGYIGTAAKSATFAFAGTISNVVDLTVTEENGLIRPKVRLYNPDGTLAGSAPSGSCAAATSVALTSVTLTQDGTYTVLVGDCLDTSTGDYNLTSSCSGTCPVTPLITWATPAAITYGTALSATQLDATASVPGTTITGNMVYSPLLGTVPQGGSRTLTATYTPSDLTAYTTATATVPLTVIKVIPTLTWATPAPITYGTLLSATQLDAVASAPATANAPAIPVLPGKYSYAPGVGALLPGGSQMLSVIFNATDSTDYTTATDSVSLSVNQAAELTSPAPTTTLTGASQAFGWSAGAGATAYIFHLGTLGLGSDDVYAQGSTTLLTASVTGIPMNGVTLYARLYSKINGNWQFVDTTYTEFGSSAPPTLTSPTSGSTLLGSSAVFTWSADGGATAYIFHLGSLGVGSDDLYNSGSTTGLSASVTGIPVEGALVYARLYWKINGALSYADYTFTEAGASGPAALTSPTPSTLSTPSILTGSSVTFHWSSGSGVTAYVFNLGTTGVGSRDVYASGSITATSALVNSIPVNGATLYARLYWKINGTLSYADYTYTEKGTPAPGVLNSPTPNTLTPLTGASQTFSWSAGSGVTEYIFHLGNLGVGSDNLYAQGSTTTTFANVTGIPVNGAKLYARLYSEIDGVLQYTDYTYYELGTPAAAVLNTPTPSTILSSTFNGTFSWSAGSGVTAYIFHLGTKGIGSDDLYAQGSTTALSANVTGIPQSGVTLYARLYSDISGVWTSADYTYTASGTTAASVLNSPTPGTILSPTFNGIFSWSAGSGVAANIFRLGSQGVGSDDLYNSGSVTVTTETVAVPTNGGTLFARLYSEINGAWTSSDYTYTESGTPAVAVLLTPTPSTLTPLTSSSQAFGWSTGTGVTAYMLWVGSKGIGSNNLYDVGSTLLTTATVTGLPTTGVKLYVRLWSEIDGAWQSADYTYIAE